MACAVNPNIDASDVWPLCQGILSAVLTVLSPKSILPQCHHSVTPPSMP